jgi:hypothetical protein
MKTKYTPFMILCSLVVLSACAATDSDDEFDSDDDGDGETESVGVSVDDVSTANRWQPPSGGRAVAYDGAPAWRSDRTQCTKSRPGTSALRSTLNRRFPAANASFPYNCRPNTANARLTSVHGIGRAIDIMVPMKGANAGRAVGDPIAKYLVLNAQSLGVQLVIWDRTSWSARAPQGTRYTGPNPHTDHIHVELSVEGSAR